MKCPKCNNEDTKVIDSRPTADISEIRRRRECTQCKHRFTTYERYDTQPIVVIKKNGSSEAFDPEKLFRGILMSFAKRPIDTNKIKGLIEHITEEIKAKNMTEIKSTVLGVMVLKQLLDIDQVAYIRFASVYMEFNNVNEFDNILSNLKK